MFLFRVIFDFLLPLRANEVLVREATLEKLGTHVEPHLVTLLGQECTVLLPYRIPLVRALIVETKFKANTRAAAHLGNALREHLESEIEDMVFEKGNLILVPVPLSTQRLKERGFNQVTRIIEHALSGGTLDMVHLSDVLTRTIDTAPQTTLSRTQRLLNLTNAFTVHGTIDSSATYIVVDDVTTTGATLQSACEALRNAGAKHLQRLVLAH